MSPSRETTVSVAVSANNSEHIRNDVTPHHTSPPFSFSLVSFFQLAKTNIKMFPVKVSILADKDHKWELKTLLSSEEVVTRNMTFLMVPKCWEERGDIKIKSYLSRRLSTQHQTLISAEQHETILGCQLPLSASLGTWLFACGLACRSPYDLSSSGL